jgi:nucleotide-binding universal stress UspA family protein
MIISDTITAVEQHAKERTSNARANLAEFCQRRSIPAADDPPGPDGVSVAWREETGDEYDQITSRTRYHDVVVLAGGPERAGRLADEALGGIILGSGRPVFLASEQTSMAALDRIAVAWKDVPESARAITAAMPLLRRARHIDVFSVNESDEAAPECIDCSDRIVRYLRWHGFNAKSQLVLSAGRAPVDALLESARGAGAELLVMGAYGHSRVREFIFGGFTHRILKGVELPVLLFH